jgi:hypothetical protein
MLTMPRWGHTHIVPTMSVIYLDNKCKCTNITMKLGPFLHVGDIQIRPIWLSRTALLAIITVSRWNPIHFVPLTKSQAHKRSPGYVCYIPWQSIRGKNTTMKLAQFVHVWYHINPSHLAIKDGSVSDFDDVTVGTNTFRSNYGVTGAPKEAKLCLLYTVTINVVHKHHHEVGSISTCGVHINPCKLAIKDCFLSRYDRVMVKPETFRAFYGVNSPQKRSRICLLYTVTIHMVHEHHHKVGFIRPCWVHINPSHLPIKDRSVAILTMSRLGQIHFLPVTGLLGHQRVPSYVCYIPWQCMWCTNITMKLVQFLRVGYIQIHEKWLSRTAFLSGMTVSSWSLTHFVPFTGLLEHERSPGYVCNIACQSIWCPNTTMKLTQFVHVGYI